MSNSGKQFAQDGWSPQPRGHTPKISQDGIKPAASSGASKPPTGGSGIIPPAGSGKK